MGIKANPNVSILIPGAGDETILLDTSILVEHYRATKTNKNNTTLFRLSATYQRFAISTITIFELWRGDSQPAEKQFWEEFLARVQVLDFDHETAKIAGNDYLILRKSGNSIGIEDVLIAATAKQHYLRVATANTSHFQRIPDIRLVLL